MQPDDFFVDQEDPEWDLKGLNPERRMRPVLEVAFIERVRQAPQPGIDDIDVVHALTQLAHSELEEYGTSGNQRLNDQEITAVLRSIRTILKRHGVTFDPPFRDFTGFHGYWSGHDMSGPGGWAARRGFLNDLFNPVFLQVDQLSDERTARTNLTGVDGHIKNLIFASTGSKPQIVLRDALNNVIEVTKYAEYCLFYDRPLGESGLSWGELVEWWRDTQGLDNLAEKDVAYSLYNRLLDSFQSNPAERLVFRTYCERYAKDVVLPALLPQVYLHYDPLTLQQRHGRPSVLPRERMDFLLLFPGRARVVIEVDGKQHYAEGDKASPCLYGEMVAEDRRLRLRGYEVYRFAGLELVQPGGAPQSGAVELLRTFFDQLSERYQARADHPGKRLT